MHVGMVRDIFSAGLCAHVLCGSLCEPLADSARTMEAVHNRVKQKRTHAECRLYKQCGRVMFVLTQYGICYKNAQRKFKQMIVREKQIMVSIARVIVKQFDTSHTLELYC